jgi:serine/threonine protein kinase
LIGKIAEGGMGEVWRARQVSLNRAVALKLIRAGHLATPTDVQRFRLEAEAAARLDHEGIVRVYEVGEHEGRHYLSMELIEGASLAEQIGDGAWTLQATHAARRQRDIAGLIAAVARAVHHAHQRGVLHRDLKPANILIDPQGRPHLTDFGLAKILEHDSGLTRSTAILGTPGYLSPEQAAGRSTEVTIASDIYSLGAILYELLTGRPPFCGASTVETLRLILDTEPRRPRNLNPSVAGDLEVISLKCLEKEPSRRYASAEALAQDLERWLRREPIQARPATPLERTVKFVRRHPVTVGLSVALGLCLVLGLAATTWQWRRAERQRDASQRLNERLELQRAEDLFESGSASLALAVLARHLRDHPAHRTAQERLVNALSQRTFLLSTKAPGGPTNPLADPQLSFRHALSPDGARLATATNAGVIAVWETAAGRSLLEISAAHTNVIRSVAFSPAGERLVSASADRTAKLWDSATGRLLFNLSHPDSVQHADFSSNGALLVTACRDGIARFWDTATGQRFSQEIQHARSLNSARFSPDGSLVATSDDEGVVRLWHAADGQPASEPFRVPGAALDVQFTSNGRRLRVDVGTVNGIEAHFLRWTSAASLSAAREGIPQPALPTDLTRFAAPLHQEQVTATDPSPDGRLLATASVDGTARIWDRRTRQPLTEPLQHGAPVNGVRFSPDGLRLATSAAGSKGRVWSVETGQPLTDWLLFPEPVSAVAFSGDGARVLFAAVSGGLSWEIHLASRPAPEWLPEVAEAIAGVRLTEQRLARAVEPETRVAIARRLSTLRDDEPLAAWAKRLLDAETEGQ